jgi:energy-coupling factor transporter ATP-binding protein EcfA2
MYVHFSQIGPALMSVVSFIVLGATSANGAVNAGDVFSALVYFNMLRLPLMMLPMSLNMLFESRVAVARITKFLTAAELDSQPERLPFVVADAEAEGAAGEQKQKQQPAIEFEGASFCWEVEPPAEAFSVRAGAGAGGKPPGAGAGSGGKPSGPAAAAGAAPASPSAPGTDATAAPAAAAAAAPAVVANVLSGIDLAIPRGSLCAVIGAVGCGKTSLLAGLLGELKRTAGAVRLRGRVGYCPQQAWIQVNDADVIAMIRFVTAKTEKQSSTTGKEELSSIRIAWQRFFPLFFLGNVSGSVSQPPVCIAWFPPPTTRTGPVHALSERDRARKHPLRCAVRRTALPPRGALLRTRSRPRRAAGMRGQTGYCF